MIRPSSRSSSRRRVSKRWQSRGVGPARRKWTMRRPSSVITGIRRAVSGSREVAKCVVIRSREHVAWSIEVAFPAVGTELVRHCHFTGEAPQYSSAPLLEVADSGRVTDENQRKRAETRGTGAIAPNRKSERVHAWSLWPRLGEVLYLPEALRVTKRGRW